MFMFRYLNVLQKSNFQDQGDVIFSLRFCLSVKICSSCNIFANVQYKQSTPRRENERIGTAYENRLLDSGGKCNSGRKTVETVVIIRQPLRSRTL